MPAEYLDIEQGSLEWLSLRKKKITATDACVIMGVSPWKTKKQLYLEKKSDEILASPSQRMKRGLDLEPIARDLFNLYEVDKMIPKVFVNDWTMASLDGINQANEILEIKCPGDKDHNEALRGKIPSHYYPQLQHQMYVCNANKVFYYSFDGFDGVTVEVLRDDAYIEKMIIEEKKFYECLMNNTPPDPSDEDYIERTDELWDYYATHWMKVTESIKTLELQEQELREELICMSGERNCKGGGIVLSQVERKGFVDYTSVPELSGIDLDKYRKQGNKIWRITKS